MKNPKISKDEIRLIKDAQAGDIRAFNRIFYKYKGFVDNLIYQYLKDMDEARDLTNIVFLKVYEKLSKFTAYNSFGGWLRILAKNTAIDYLRSIKQKDVSTDSCENSMQIQLPSGDDEMSTINKMTYNHLVNQFDDLPLSYGEVAKLYYCDNLTVAQISDVLNVPEGTIKSDLHRMRKILKSKFNK